MKKIILCLTILLLFALLLSACTPSADPVTDPTGETTVPTEPTTHNTETTAPMNNTAGADLPEVVVVRHTEGATYDLPGKAVDTGIMKDGYLYAISSESTRQISVEPVDNWCVTTSRVLYVTQAEPSVIRSTHYVYSYTDAEFYTPGKDYTVKAMQYADGQLLLAMQHNSRNLVEYSFITVHSSDPKYFPVESALMGVYQIDAFTYAASSAEFPDVREHISKEDLGATIRWKGKFFADDTEIREYYYFVETGEHWDATTFERVSEPVPCAYGSAFVYDPENNSGAEFTQCVPGYLYYQDEINNKVYFISDEQIASHTTAFGKVFFVKAAEPAKLYVAKLSDLTEHTVVYESDFGAIAKIGQQNHLKNEALRLIEGDKRFVMLDLTTGAAEIVVELHYIYDADFRFFSKEDTKAPFESWRDASMLLIIGKENEGDQLEEYIYDWSTGKLTIASDN